MSFESTTIGLLTGSAAVTALIPAASIYFGTLPQNSGKPFVLLTRISTQPTKTLDIGVTGTDRLDNVILQVSVYDDRYLDARALADVIRGVLESSANDTKYVMTDQINAYDDFPETHSQILTFSAWHRSTTP